jgi:CRP/FNR family cyclic AMP-dependent transcriptional regulator
MEKNNLKEILLKYKEGTILYLLNEDEIEMVASYFELINYPSGSVLFNEDDPGDFIGFVVSGKLEVKKQTEFKGKQIILAMLSKGSFVGELALFDKQTRSATVRALEASTLVILRREALDSLIEQYPYTGIRILKGVIRTLSIRLRKATERLTTIF